MTYAFDFRTTARPTSPPPGLDDALDPIARMGARIVYGKDEEIFGQDEDQDLDLIYRVLSGAVRASRLLGDGRRQVGAFYRPGDLFGFEAGARRRHAAEALCDSEILVLKRSTVLAAGGALDRLIWAATNHELERTQQHILLLGRMTAREKVASFLLDLAIDVTGDTVDLPMSRLDMADYLGLTIETVSRMLSQLQASKVICLQAARRLRILNRAALTRMAR